MNVFEEVDGKVKLMKPAILSCGCMSVNSRLNTLYNITGIKPREVNHIKFKSHPLAKKWAEDNDIYKTIPQLKTSTFGVAINPELEFVDIKGGVTKDVAKDLLKILNKESI